MGKFATQQIGFFLVRLGLIGSALHLVSSPASAYELSSETYRVGVARVDVTPSYPIRLNGFGGRREESEGVGLQIWAKALASKP